MPDSVPTAPLADSELAALYGDLARFATLVVAVSGGPDSLALMATVARWAKSLGPGGPALRIVTVDHGLRGEAAAEARTVAGFAAALGLEHETAAWLGAKPVSGIQDAARAARYRLLAEIALRAHQPAAVVTAHHAEDQAETVLMRLARGSGVDGLAGMARERPLGGVVLVRPLLRVAKARLVATAAANGLAAVADPSNDSLAFERVRLRRAWPALADVGLRAPMITKAAARLARARQALEAAVDGLAASIADDHDGTFASIERVGWLAAPEEIRIRLVARALAAFGGQEGPARLSQVEVLVSDLMQPDFAGATLGGCRLRSSGREIIVYREAGRTGLPILALRSGVEQVWDRRFAVACAGPEPVEVRALGSAELSRLRSEGADLGPLPCEAAATLPSFWRHGALSAVPHLGLTLGGVTDCRARFLNTIRRNPVLDAI